VLTAPRKQPWCHPSEAWGHCHPVVAVPQGLPDGQIVLGIQRKTAIHRKAKDSTAETILLSDIALKEMETREQGAGEMILMTVGLSTTVMTRGRRQQRLMSCHSKVSREVF
jgi:hypothetical protein